MTLEDWLQQVNANGEIHPVEFGMNRSKLRDLFGAPTDEGWGWKRAEAPMILKYGDIEFHFGPKQEDGLFLVYSDASGDVDLCLKAHKEEC